MNDKLNVIYALGKDFVKYFSVALTSLMENNKKLNLDIFVIYDFKDNTELQKVADFAKSKYNIDLHLILIENSVFNNYSTSEHVYLATYFRLLIANIIPDHIETALFVDSDTIVTGSLSELANLGFADLYDTECTENEKYLYAVSEIEIEKEVNSKKITELGYPTDEYFNAGVMFINLKNWRLINTSQALIDIAEKHKSKFNYMDQDVLNMYFTNKWRPLNPTYNALHLIRQLPKIPLIIHFAGPSKPWHYMNNHPYKYLYIKYLNKTPYKSDKLFSDISFGKVLKKHFSETRDYINFYRSNEYKRIRNN